MLGFTVIVLQRTYDILGGIIANISWSNAVVPNLFVAEDRSTVDIITAVWRLGVECSLYQVNLTVCIFSL